MRTLLEQCSALPEVIYDYLRGVADDQDILIQDCLCDLECNWNWLQLAVPFCQIADKRREHYRGWWQGPELLEFAEHFPLEYLMLYPLQRVRRDPDFGNLYPLSELATASRVGLLFGIWLLGNDVPDDIAFGFQSRGITSMPLRIRLSGGSMHNVMEWMASTPTDNRHHSLSQVCWPICPAGQRKPLRSNKQWPGPIQLSCPNWTTSA